MDARWALALMIAACGGENTQRDGGRDGMAVRGDAGPDGSVICERLGDCDDGVFCNGQEECVDTMCVRGPAPCASGDECVEAKGRCVAASCTGSAGDRDGDRHISEACGGDDCDDDDPDRYAGNPERCDSSGHDEDCRPETLEGGDGDVDGDGAISSSCCNLQADGALLCGTDCDDGRTGEFRDTVESCGVCGRSCYLACGADLECDEIVQLSAGDEHTCGVVRSGRVVCWGSNTAGQLGDGTVTSSNRPVEVRSVSDAVEVAAGTRFTCVLRMSGRVSCWGSNSDGQTGSGSTRVSERDPVDVRSDTSTLLDGVVHIAAGDSHACALRTAGEVFCWGADARGQVDGPPALSRFIYAQRVTGVSGATAIAAGASHSCALSASGTASCWGSNDQGQLGDGVATHGSTCGGVDCAPPVAVAATSLETIEAGGDRSCGVDTAGGVSCWGQGTGSTPVAVAGIAEAHVVGVATAHQCAIHGADRIVSCWGANSVGQLGTGDQMNRTVPADTGLRNAASVALGAAPGVGHSCALESTGRVTCWGSNRSSQLGDGMSSHPSCEMAFFWGDCSPTPSMLARP